jgi:hypothetical protein
MRSHLRLQLCIFTENAERAGNDGKWRKIAAVDYFSINPSPYYVTRHVHTDRNSKCAL